MKRRIVVIVAGALALSGLGSGAQALGTNTTQSTDYWGCAGVRAIDHGVCLKNPLPERLPVPSVPTAPSVS